MTLKEIVEALDWQVLAGTDFLEREVSGGYVADLLSCVMAGADAGHLWITLQTHGNIIAVASLLSLSGIVIAEGATVPDNTLAKAAQQEVVVLSSPDPVYETVVRLASLGI
jgi:predicted transcriptional regulator